MPNKFNRIHVSKTPLEENIPAQGYYVSMTWADSNKPGATMTTITYKFPAMPEGPLIDFLNTIDAMVELYKAGKESGFSGYATVPGYDRWFDRVVELYKDGKESGSNDVTPDTARELRNAINPQIRTTPEGFIAWLKSYSVVYCDGTTPYQYPVTPRP